MGVSVGAKRACFGFVQKTSVDMGEQFHMRIGIHLGKLVQPRTAAPQRHRAALPHCETASRGIPGEVTGRAAGLGIHRGTMAAQWAAVRWRLLHGQVAGVIGTTKLRYDMWGSDVLVASTLEGQCEPGRSAAVPHTRRTT